MTWSFISQTRFLQASPKVQGSLLSFYTLPSVTCLPEEAAQA